MPALSFIVEWESFSFDRLKPFEITLLVALFFCLLRGVRLPWLRLALLLGFLHMALQHRRFSTVMVLLGVLLLAEPIAAMLKPRAKEVTSGSSTRAAKATIFAAVFALCIAAVRFQIPAPIEENHLTPVSALASVPETLL